MIRCFGFDSALTTRLEILGWEDEGFAGDGALRSLLCF